MTPTMPDLPAARALGETMAHAADPPLRRLARTLLDCVAALESQLPVPAKSETDNGALYLAIRRADKAGTPLRCTDVTDDEAIDALLTAGLIQRAQHGGQAVYVVRAAQAVAA
jgi:hypothetical protein